MGSFQESIKRVFSKSYSIVAAVFIISLLGFCCGERMESFGIYGDEARFFMMTNDFQTAIFDKKLNDYYVTRTLLPGLIYYTGKALSIPLSVKKVISIYGAYNIIFLTFSAWVWCLIARQLQISIQGRWLGFLALFCNYAILKYIPYTQVTMDALAYFVGLLFVYFYLRDSFWGLLFLTIAGTFVWPTVIYIGPLLLLFKRGQSEEQTKRAPYYLNWAVAFGIAVFIFWKMTIFYKLLISGAGYKYGIFSIGANRPLFSVIYGSMAVTSVYLFVAIGTLLNSNKLFNIKYIFSKFTVPRIIAVVAVFAGLKTIISRVAAVSNAFPLDFVLFNMTMASIIQPACFLFAHVIYFGPFMLLIYLLWIPTARLIRAQGIGLVLCTLLIVGQALHSESRLLMQFYPMLVPFVIKVLDGYWLRARHLWILGVLSVVYSKVWLMVHRQPWGSDPFGYPNQYYFMNFGPYMSHTLYIIQAGCILVTAAVIYWCVIHNNKEFNKG